MKRQKVIKFYDFMDGSYKHKEKTSKRKIVKDTLSIAGSAAIPLLLTGGVGAVSIAMAGARTFAATTNIQLDIAIPAVAQAVPTGAKEWMSEQTLSALAHVLDPLVDIMVSLSFPIASVIIVGSCFFFMFNKSEKAWEMMMKAGLGYVLIQVSPLILNVLKQVGNAV
ncbi:hypothetical protein [Bacillus sp. FJAT-49736]|uniref:hypothetical protein n=1 Tax=Bacillus sp. FJAT-49736 TaxID=2833582 RepID=UPI001BC923F8|nr:hypothetical protein [Bacillus sp. FJAT-49736]MBS4172149.1 hypothetical protein [Bacillus sp. FJAT-49736]